MRFALKTEGGLAHLPGLAREISVKTDDLAQTEAKELETYVERCDFFRLPETPYPSRSADARTYVLTVRRGKTSHTVRVTEPVPSGPLKSLIESLRCHG